MISPATLAGTLTSQQRRPEMTRSEFSTGISAVVNTAGNLTDFGRIEELSLYLREKLSV
jgi:hypothetical protein